MYSPGDVQTAKFLIQSSGENEELTDAERSAVIEQDMKRLQVMIGYCKTTDCLRGYILGYFGQAHPAHGGVLLTDQAGAVLFHGESVFMTTRTPLAAEKKRGKKKSAAVEHADNSLFETLRALRFQLSQ